jgi:excinuclease ABC subunit A
MTAQQMARAILELGAGRKVILFAPMVSGRKGEYARLFERLAREGFVRVRVNGELYDIEEVPKLDKNRKHTIQVVVDRIVVKDNVMTRLMDSIETACRLSGGTIAVEDDAGGSHVYSEHYGCPVCNTSVREISPRMFSFNNPHGACETCHGLGVLMEIDPDLVVPDAKRSLSQGAIAAWGVPPGKFASRMIRHLARSLRFDEDTPFENLPEDARRVILYGGPMADAYSTPFEGVIPNLMRRMKETATGEISEDISRFLNNITCPTCRGARLKQEILHLNRPEEHLRAHAMSVDDMSFYPGAQSQP